MIIGILGGTGKMGLGLAKHLSKRNQVVIGSRNPGRAREAAEKVHGASGADYASASSQADVVVVVVPYSAIGGVAAVARELAGKLVISAVNPLKVEDGLFRASGDASAAEELAKLLPGSRVATGFNNIPSSIFARDEIPPMDILVAADSKETYEEAAKLVSSVDNLRPLHAGPLSQASVVEGLTALVLNLAKLNGTGGLATKFVSRRSG